MGFNLGFKGLKLDFINSTSDKNIKQKVS